MKPKKSVSVIGLDIGNYSVKCVDVTRTKDKITLNSVNVLPLEGQSNENLTVLLKPFLDILTASPDHIRIVMSGSSLLVRCVALPTMSQAEMQSAIRFEAENHIAFPIDDCILDFQIVNQIPDKKMMNVLLVAAKRDFIQERLKMLFDMGVRPEVIDVDTFSLVNAYQALSSDPVEKIYGLLNIGHRVSSFAIIQDKEPLFVREIPMGGATITKALAEAKGISEDEAQRLKHDHSPERIDDLKAATRKGLEAMVDELKHSIDFFENEAGEPLKSVRLSGGSAQAVDAPEFITEALGRPAALWDSLKRLEIGAGVNADTLKEHASALNIALGMAVRD